MDAEPQILGEPPPIEIEIDVNEDELRYTEVEFRRKVNSEAASVRRIFQGKLKERDAEIERLQAELAKRPPPLDADAMSLDDLEREMSAQEYEQFVSPRIRKTLRDWLAADRRITPGAK